MMVLFEDAESYVLASGLSQKGQSRLLDFLSRFKKGDYLPYPAVIEPARCFSSTDLRLRSLFYFRVYHQDDGPQEETVCIPFSGNFTGTSEVRELIEVFVRYLSGNILPVEAVDLEADVAASGADISGAFMVCQDHEGLMSLAAFQKDYDPGKGIMLLYATLESRYSDLFPF